ncbi:hypothetical protein ME786_18810 [Lactobacillus delbrueckii]|nr:hypothetical protein ME786_18810 [Lactobacillus delbrueckii]
MTFMQAKHVQKGSQGGLIEDVQKRAKKSASVVSCRYFESGVQFWYNLCSISINQLRRFINHDTYF